MTTFSRFRSCLLMFAALSSAPLVADSIVSTDAFLPIVHVVGMSGTWRTDVSIFNPNAQATRVTFYFGPADTDASDAQGMTLTPDLQSRETVTFTDMLPYVFNVSGYGLLEVKSDLPILVTGNAYNVAGSCPGTLGAFSAGQPERNSVGFGNTNDYNLYVTGIPHDQNHLTSAAVLNPTGVMLHAKIELVDGAGNGWGSDTADVPPFSLHQFSDVFVGGVFGHLHPPYDSSWRLNFYVNLNNGATLLAYATITDLRSGDPYLVPAQAQVVNVPLVRPAPDGSVRAPSPLGTAPVTFTRGVPLTEPASPRR